MYAYLLERRVHPERSQVRVLLEAYGTDYAEVRHRDAADATVLDAFFGAGGYARASFESVQLFDLEGLLIPGSVDQEWLHLHRELVEGFLAGGRIVVFSGHLFRPWLPGASSFIPKEINSFRDYAVRVVTPHQIFAGVRPEDLTFRKGVAGFFARGHHPPPPGAEVLLALADGDPITYRDRSSSGGTILLHSGNDLWGYAGDESTAGRIAPQLLAWIGEEGRRE